MRRWGRLNVYFCMLPNRLNELWKKQIVVRHLLPNSFLRFRSWCGTPAPSLSSLWLAEPRPWQDTIPAALSTTSTSPITFRKKKTKKKHAYKSQRGNLTINEQYNNVKPNCFRRPPGPNVSSISKYRLNLDDSDWDWQENCYFPRGLQVVLSCIVSASVLVLRVNLEEKQKWRLYMTHYLWSQRGNSSHNSGLAYLCTVIWNTT